MLHLSNNKSSSKKTISKNSKTNSNIIRSNEDEIFSFEGLYPWRTAINPHPDIINGLYPDCLNTLKLYNVIEKEKIFDFTNPVYFF